MFYETNYGHFLDKLKGLMKAGFLFLNVSNHDWTEDFYSVVKLRFLWEDVENLMVSELYELDETYFLKLFLSRFREIILVLFQHCQRKKKNTFRRAVSAVNKSLNTL